MWEFEFLLMVCVSVTVLLLFFSFLMTSRLSVVKEGLDHENIEWTGDTLRSAAKEEHTRLLSWVKLRNYAILSIRPLLWYVQPWDWPRSVPRYLWTYAHP